MLYSFYLTITLLNSKPSLIILSFTIIKRKSLYYNIIKLFYLVSAIKQAFK